MNIVNNNTQKLIAGHTPGLSREFDASNRNYNTFFSSSFISSCLPPIKTKICFPSDKNEVVAADLGGIALVAVLIFPCGGLDPALDEWRDAGLAMPG